MEIISIFANNLWSIQYEGEKDDEFTRLFESWHNIEYLYDFLFDNENLLNTPFWEGYSIDKAVEMIYKEAKDLEQYFLQLYKNSERGIKPDFDDEFHPISDGTYEWKLIRSKAYGRNITPSFLRLYAIKVQDNAYVITGGAIKLTKKMNNVPYLSRELDKLKSVRSWFKEIGIEDTNDIKQIKDE